jgi:fructose-bisphosphate aldolase, class II
MGTVIPRDPVFLVMHSSSGSDEQAFRDTIAHGVVKVNINAATQFAYCAGIREYMLDRKEVSCMNKVMLLRNLTESGQYLDKPVGNLDDPMAPNKQFFDTRQWIQQDQWRMVECLEEILDSMNTSHQL